MTLDFFLAIVPPALRALQSWHPNLDITEEVEVSWLPAPGGGKWMVSVSVEKWACCSVDDPFAASDAEARVLGAAA